MNDAEYGNSAQNMQSTLLCRVAENMQANQCRAARALIGWSRTDLSKASRVSTRAIASYENEESDPYERTLDAIRIALESAGVIFLDPNGNGPGVALRRASPEE